MKCLTDKESAITLTVRGLVRNPFKEKESNYKSKEKKKGNDEILFRMQNSTQVISLERKSTLLGNIGLLSYCKANS